MTPYADQSKIVDKLGKWAKTPDLCISLIGAAGTGKTVLTSFACDRFESDGREVQLSASTHKAAAQLRQATGRGAMTVHKRWGIKMRQDHDTGELVASMKSGKGPELEYNSVQVLDEAGMIPHAVLGLVLEKAARYDLQLLFVGDAAQLAPVGEGVCEAVDPDAKAWTRIKLSKIRRQAAKNPIIQASIEIRESKLFQLPELSDSNNDGAGVVVIPDYREWEALMLETVSQGSETGNRYLGYTNAAVDGVAKDARRIKYGRHADDPYLPGEVLTVNERCIANDGTTVVENNSELVVSSVEHKGDFYLVTGKVDGMELSVVAMENYSLRKFRLNRLAAEARAASRRGVRSAWAKFWDSSNRIADLRSAITSTIHKAQGSTMQDVFLNMDQITLCQARDPNNLDEVLRAADERRRLAYVGATRAARGLYVTGDWSEDACSR